MLKRLHSKDFKHALDSENGVLLDIRTKEELDTYGTISQNQTHIDVYLPDAIEKIMSLDKNKTYYIYCWHGNRSQQVGNYMTQNGFNEVYDLIGGIEEWKLFRQKSI